MSSHSLPRPAAPPARPPRALALVRDPKPEEVGAAIDWTPWHLEWEDDVGQSPEQDQIVHAVRSALAQRMRELGKPEVWVGNDAFFAWVPEAPLVRVSPDVYTLPGRPPEPLPRMFHTWLPGHAPPVFALEVVSDDWKKDYEDAPAKYALLGATELAIFDVDALQGRAKKPRVPLQLYRREGDGAFVRVYAGPGPVRAETIDSWLVARRESDLARVLRLSRDAAGLDEVPTAEERADDETRRADDEKRRADDEKLRADEERRRADEESRRADEESRRADALAAELEELRRSRSDR